MDEYDRLLDELIASRRTRREAGGFGGAGRMILRGLGDFGYNMARTLQRVPSPFTPSSWTAEGRRRAQDETTRVQQEAAEFYGEPTGVTENLAYMGGRVLPYLAGGGITSAVLRGAAPGSAAARLAGYLAQPTKSLSLPRALVQSQIASLPTMALEDIGQAPEESIAAMGGEMLDSDVLRALSQTAAGRIGADIVGGALLETPFRAAARGYRWLRGARRPQTTGAARFQTPDVTPPPPGRVDPTLMEADDPRAEILRRIEELRAGRSVGESSPPSPLSQVTPAPPPPAAALEPPPLSGAQPGTTLSSGPFMASGPYVPPDPTRALLTQREQLVREYWTPFSQRARRVRSSELRDQIMQLNRVLGDREDFAVNGRLRTQDLGALMQQRAAPSTPALRPGFEEDTPLNTDRLVQDILDEMDRQQPGEAGPGLPGANEPPPGLVDAYGRPVHPPAGAEFTYLHPRGRGGMRLEGRVDWGGEAVPDRVLTPSGHTWDGNWHQFHIDWETLADATPDARMRGVLSFDMAPDGAISSLSIRTSEMGQPGTPKFRTFSGYTDAAQHAAGQLGHVRMGNLMRAVVRYFVRGGMGKEQATQAVRSAFRDVQGGRITGARPRAEARLWNALNTTGAITDAERAFLNRGGAQARLDMSRLIDRMLREDPLSGPALAALRGAGRGLVQGMGGPEGVGAVGGFAYGVTAPGQDDLSLEERAIRGLLFSAGGSALGALGRAGAFRGGMRSGPALGPGGAPEPPRYAWTPFVPTGGKIVENVPLPRDVVPTPYMRGLPQLAEQVNDAHRAAWQQATSGQPGEVIDDALADAIDFQRRKLGEELTEQLDPQEIARYVATVADGNPGFLARLRDELQDRLQILDENEAFPIYVARFRSEGPRAESFVRAFLDPNDALEWAAQKQWAVLRAGGVLPNEAPKVMPRHVARIDRGEATLNDVYGVLSQGTDAPQLVVRNPLAQPGADPGDRALAAALHRGRIGTDIPPDVPSSLLYTGPAVPTALPFGSATSAARVLGSAGEAALGTLLSQSEDENLRASGWGLMGLAAFTALGPGGRRAIASGLKQRAQTAGRQHELVRKALDWLTPRIMLDEQVARAIDESETLRNVFRVRGEKLAQRAEALGPEADRFLTDVITGESFSTYLPTPEEAKQIATLAADVIDMFAEQRGMKQALGLLEPGGGVEQYLPRYQLRHMLEEGERLQPVNRTGDPNAPRQRPEPGRTLGTSADDLMARDYLGEIREASFSIRHGAARGGAQIANTKLLQALDQVPGSLHPQYRTRQQAVTLAHQAWLQARAAKDPAQAQFAKLYKDAVADLRTWSRSFRHNANWKKLPESTALGPLSGAVVQREVADYVIGTPVQRTVYDGLLRGWKASKTAYNLPTHTGNFMSNIYLAHMAGVPIWKLPKMLVEAARDVKGYGDATQYLMERGVLNHNILTAEAQGASVDVFASAAERLERELRILMRTTRPATEKVLKEYGFEALPMPSALAERAGKVHKTVTGLYSNEDNWFRVAVYKQKLSEGWTQEQAANYAKWSLVDYDTKSPALAFARRWMFPFILFPAKALPMVLTQAADHPMRFLTAAALFATGAELLQQQYPEVTAQDVPADIRKPTFGYLLPQLLPVGVGERGQRYFADVTRLTPFSALTTNAPPGTVLGQTFPDLPLAALQPSGPLMDVASLALNRDPYSGRPVLRPGERTSPLATAGKAASFLAQRAAPPMLGFHAPRLLADVQEQRYGDLAVDALGLVGARPRIVPRGEAQRRAQARYNETIRDIETNYRYQRQRARNSPEQIEQIKRTYQERMRAALDRYRHDLRP